MAISSLTEDSESSKGGETKAKHVHVDDASGPSRLPFELEREIFDIAALDSPKCIPTFLRIARRFHTWFEPELYRVLRVGEGRVVPPIFNNSNDIASNDPSLSPSTSPISLDLKRLSYFGPYVHHALLQNLPVSSILQILHACPNIQNLALWIIHGTTSPPLTLALERLPLLLKLSFDPTYFFENYAWDFSIPFDQPLFRNITHLEIVNTSTSWAKWRQLALLPKLTHLAMAGTGTVAKVLVDGVLGGCAGLEVFVMFYVDFRTIVEEMELMQRDGRVVYLKAAEDHLEHWEVGARGGEDFWVVAEKRIKKRREERDRSSTFLLDR